MIRITMAAAVAALMLAGCTTDVREMTPQGAVAAVKQPVKVIEVHGQVSAKDAPADLVLRLTQAIRGQMPGVEGKPVKLEFDVVDYKKVSPAARALVGMLAGGNRLHVIVTLRDEGGALVRQFDVDRNSNPGGLGAVTDQEGEMIEAAANAIVQTLAK